jgi:hypothetical protein
MKPFPPHWGQFGLAPPQWQGRRGEWSGLSAISLSGCLSRRAALAGPVVSGVCEDRGAAPCYQECGHLTKGMTG